MRLFISIISLFSFVILSAQKRITITDPEIELSYELPVKWKYEDDEYYIFIFPPSSIGNEFLQITYSESGEVGLKVHFDFLMEKVLPLNEIDFKFIEKGHLEGTSNTVQYGVFDSRLEGVMYRNLIYLFQENGQTFQIRGIAMPQNFEKLKSHYKSISLSIRSKKI